MRNKRIFRNYKLTFGEGINNEPSFLLIGEGVICKYFPIKTHTKELAIKGSIEHLELLKQPKEILEICI